MRVEIDHERFEVRVDGKKKHLTEIQFRIFAQIVGADGRLVSQKDLLRKVWGYSINIQKGLKTKVVEKHISRLRCVLQVKRPLIRTVAKRGYALIR